MVCLGAGEITVVNFENGPALMVFDYETYGYSFQWD